RSVEEFGRLQVVIDHVVAKLNPNGLRVYVGPAGIIHGDDAVIQIRPRLHDGSMEIVGECRDPTAPRRMVADERDTLKSLHSLFLCARVSRRHRPGEAATASGLALTCSRRRNTAVYASAADCVRR